MTIPVLISEYNKNVVVSRMQKFYSNFNQAIKMSELENGPAQYWMDDFADTNYSDDPQQQIKFFENYLKKYLKCLKYEVGHDGTYFLSGVKIYFNDGSAALMGHGHIAFFPVANKTDVDGKDKFLFYWRPYTNGMIPYGYQFKEPDYANDRDALINDEKWGCGPGKRTNRRFCAALIMHDGWKISKGYPIRF